MMYLYCVGGSTFPNTPRNVRLTSRSMNLVLRWDAPEGSTGVRFYTTEFRTSVTPYRSGCVNVSSLECDFSHLGVSEYATYTGRVRTQGGGETSTWVESNRITLDKDTTIGPPNVTLLSNGGTLEVAITDPEFTISTLRSVFSSATYNISYWKDGRSDEVRSISDTQQNRVVLTDLEPWTRYCVQVQIHTERNLRPSEPSRPVCDRTTNDAEPPWAAAVVTFVVMSVGVALLVVAVIYRRRISHFLCPKDTLPQHIKEYLLAPPTSATYLPTHICPPPEEIYHQVSIVDMEQTEENRRDVLKQPDIPVDKTQGMSSTEDMAKT